MAQKNEIDFKPLLLRIIKKENSTSNLDEVKEFVRTVLEFNETSYKEECLFYILHILEHYQNDRIFHEIWGMIESSPPTYEPLVKLMNQHLEYAKILDIYLQEKFNSNRIEDILDELSILQAGAPYLVLNTRFQKKMLQKIANLVGGAPHSFIAASTIKAFKVPDQPEFINFKEKMMVHTEAALLNEIDLKKISLSEIEFYAQLSTGKMTEKYVHDKKSLNKYIILNTLIELFSTHNVSIIKQLPFSFRDELRDVLKSVLRNTLSPQYFPLLLTAYEDEDGGYYYNELFSYLSKHGDESLMLAFINWTVSNLRLDHHYYRSLKNYLKSNPKSIWKDKGARKELQSFTIPRFRKMIKEVQHDSASPVVKFFKKYGIQTVVTMMMILAIGSGGYYFYGKFFNSKENVAISKENKPAKTVATEPIEETKPSAEDPFIEWTKNEPLQVNLNGGQKQLIFGEANPNGGKSLVLVDSNGEYRFDLSNDFEKSPFDSKGNLQEDLTLYGTEYDFNKDNNFEIVIVARNAVQESYIWIYSYNKETSGFNQLFANIGKYGVKLEEEKLILLNGLQETYILVDQKFITP